VHRVNIAFTLLFPAPLSPSNVSNTIVEKSTPIRPQESALYRHFCSPLSFAKVAALPRKGSPVTGFGWIIVRSTARSQSAGRIPFPAMSTSRSRGTLDWVRIWQKTFVCRGAYPQIRISYMTAWLSKTSTGRPHRGHGLHAQSAVSKGTPRCHLSSVE